MKKVVTLFFLILLPAFCTAQYKLKQAFPALSFLQPTDFQQPPDGSNRNFVLTQQGIIYVFPNDSSVQKAKVFLDLTGKVKYGGELGLLGLAFHPDYKNNGYFYINYTTDNPLRSIIARFSVLSGNPDSADAASQFNILELNQPYENHNAGQLAFGKDGYLYIGFGDGGGGGDPLNNGQNRKVLLGKMLRIDVNKTSAAGNYSIPPDNPFVGNSEGFREEIYAYGLRNPWRFSFDPATDWLWVADVGQDLWEEVDILKKGGNYGWRIMEGLHCYNPPNCDTAGLIKPIWEYGHNSEGGNSISGGYVYRGRNFPELIGKYIYADFVSGRIWALSYNGTTPAENKLLIQSGKNISTFGVDSSKELFVCAFDGQIYKLASNLVFVKSEKPMEYNLGNNFPNPFNLATEITVDIKESGEAKLEIFDTNGKKIDLIYEGRLEPGSYKFEWDAGNNPSGVYIYQLTTGNFKAAKKMVLAK